MSESCCANKFIVDNFLFAYILEKQLSLNKREKEKTTSV